MKTIDLEVNIVRLAVIWLQQVESKYQDELPDKIYDVKIEVLLDFWKNYWRKNFESLIVINVERKDYSKFA